MLALTLIVVGGLLLYTVISGNARAVFVYFFPDYLRGRASTSGTSTTDPVAPAFDPNSGYSIS